MDRVNGADWINIGGGKRGFRSEAEAAGIPGTEVTAGWLNDIQENLARVIEGAGLALAAGNWGLLEEAIARIAVQRALANIPIDGSLSSPPGSPAEGTQVLIAAGATGAWAGRDGQIARVIGGAWRYEVPRAGRVVTEWSGSRLVTRRYDGTAWAEVVYATANAAGFTQTKQPRLTARTSPQSQTSSSLQTISGWSVLTQDLGDATFNTANGQLSVGPNSAGLWSVGFYLTPVNTTPTSVTAAIYASGVADSIGAQTTVKTASDGLAAHACAFGYAYLAAGDSFSLTVANNSFSSVQTRGFIHYARVAS